MAGRLGNLSLLRRVFCERFINFREALNNSSMNDQSKNKSKCDFGLFFIFNNLAVIENAGTSLCHRTSEKFRDSLALLIKSGCVCIY